MIILDKTVISATEPPQTSVLWVKPVKGGGVSLYTFLYGKWQLLKVMNDEGTITTEDDTPADISNIPELVETEVTKQVGTKIEDEVTRQIADHDLDVRDTHNTPSDSEEEYPEVNII